MYHLLLFLRKVLINKSSKFKSVYVCIEKIHTHTTVKNNIFKENVTFLVNILSFVEKQIFKLDL